MEDQSVKAVNSPQLNNEKTFHVHLLVESSTSFCRNTFYNKASGSALFLIFHQISGSCSSKVVLMKKVECIVLDPPSRERLVETRGPDRFSWWGNAICLTILVFDDNH